MTSEASLTQRLQAIRLAGGELRKWLAGDSVLGSASADRQKARECVDRLQLSVEKLEAEPSLLTVVFLGGTGVGKSTLLNALAGRRIADSGLTRPTTQFATVYHHESIRIERLPAPFQECRAVAHDRDDLRFKILIDTPDIDGAVLEHHERLRQILPVADAVMYVGSAEKYHDQAAWQLLQEHSTTRAFAFILNKWDRCLASHDERTGRPPDEDFRDSLRQAGFESPFLFRVMARQWEARRMGGSDEIPLVPDDFERMEAWIEAELDERMIRDIKARGITNDLKKASDAVDRMVPEPWGPKRDRLANRWLEALGDGVSSQADMLVEAAGTQSRDLEQHFGRLGRQGIGGIFGLYLHMADRLIHLRGTLLQLTTGEKKTEVQRIAAKCVDSISDERRHHQRSALFDRLLTLASQEGWTVPALRGYWDGEAGANQLANLNEVALTQVLTQELRTLERDYSDPTGSKRAIHSVVRLLCTWLPVLVLGGIGLSLLYSLVTWNFWGFGEFFSATLLFALTMAALHLLLIWVFPVKWELLREKLRDRLQDGLLRQTSAGYLKVLDRYTQKCLHEREILVGVRDVFRGLGEQIQREDSASAGSMFAKPTSTT